MNQKELNAWMERALGLVPKGDPCQSRFRVALNIVFRNALGPKPERPGMSVADAVRFAAEGLGCRPRYDPALLSLEWPTGQ